MDKVVLLTKAMIKGTLACGLCLVLIAGPMGLVAWLAEDLIWILIIFGIEGFVGISFFTGLLIEVNSRYSKEETKNAKSSKVS